MKRLFIYAFTLSLISLSCSNEDDFKAKNLEGVIDLIIETDETEADGISKNVVIADFPLDFETEDDGKVKFTILREQQQIVEQPIVSTTRNGENRKIAELRFANFKAENVQIRAEISINNVVVSKEVSTSFKHALADSVNVKSSSLVITPGSFDEINLTTELIRNIGKVSLGSTAETKVIDTLGVSRGLFNNYRNTTDSTGNIVNKFTLGNDMYTGRLIIVATTPNENNDTLTDSITLISQ